MADNSSKRNIRNPGSTLFKKLTRIFSGPIVNYKSQRITKGRSRTLGKYNFNSLSGQEFKKVDGYNPFAEIQSGQLAAAARAERYLDFDQMEYYPELASALDMYSDEITTSSDLQKLLKIKCPNDEIKSVLESMFYKALNIESNMYYWARNLCKYGDLFLYLDVDEKIGLQNVISLPPVEIERMEGEDPTNPNYIQFQWNAAGLTFESWQVAHMRLLGNDKFQPYGTSVLDPARRIWRQLVLLEDAMMAYRIVRSPERRVFYIDVGNIEAQDVEQYIEKVKTNLRRNQVVDPRTGRIDLRYNPLSIEEDYFIPVRGDKSSRIETLPGGSYTGDIDDVQYLRDKLFSAIKIPKAYLAQTETAEDKASLSQKDIRFSRTIQRLQRCLVSELYKMAVVHLYTLGYTSERDLASFTLHLNNPSRISELQELEYLRQKFDIANGVTEGIFSKRWVSKNIFDLSDDEIIRNKYELFHDYKFASSLETIASELADQPGGGFGDELGELGAEETALPGAEEMPEEGPLLAKPGEDPAAPEGGPGTPPEAAPGNRGGKSKYKRYTPEPYGKQDMAGNRRKFRQIPTGGTQRDFPGYYGIVNQAFDETTNEDKKDEQLILETRKLIKNIKIGNNESVNKKMARLKKQKRINMLEDIEHVET